jgi:hypothetical protein
MADKKRSRKIEEQRATYIPKASPTAQNIRAALGDLVVELDTARLLRQLGLKGQPLDREALRAAPVLSPPLSVTIIEEREEQY